MTDKQSLTVGQLRDVIDDLDDSAEITVDVPVLADTHRAARLEVKINSYQPDQLIITGWNHD